MNYELVYDVVVALRGLGLDLAGSRSIEFVLSRLFRI
jgi:hypothetical protein